jgi:phosphoribosylformimino-5-aminoimidazole carboxamide ribotide isomerase
MRIIPAIDLFNNRCVRLVEGDYSAMTEYDADPVEVAKRFAECGFTDLHVVDLEGAKARRMVHLETIERMINAAPGINVQAGGGIRTEEEIRSLLEAGVSRVVVGSTAIQLPDIFESWLSRFDAGKFCAAIDLKKGILQSSAWQKSESANVEDVIRRLAFGGVTFFLCTDIERDGKLAGPNVLLYESLVKDFPHLCWIASGGVSSLNDLRSLKRTGVWGAVIGKALYEKKLLLDDLVHDLEKF